MDKLSIHGNYPVEGLSEDYTSVMDQVMQTLELVDAPTEEDFDKFTRLVVRFIEVPVALVSFVQESKDRQYFKSEIGLSGHWKQDRQTPLSHSFCQYVKRDNAPLIVNDAPQHPLVCDNLAIPDLGVRAYLGVPIHGPKDAPLGALCAIDSEVREWSKSDIVGMVDLAACVTDQINLRAALRRAHRVNDSEPSESRDTTPSPRLV